METEISEINDTFFDQNGDQLEGTHRIPVKGNYRNIYGSEYGNLSGGRKNGVWISVGGNDRLWQIGEFLDGKRAGEWQSTSLRKLIIENYIDGKKDGDEATYQILPELNPEKIKGGGSKFTYPENLSFDEYLEIQNAHEKFELISLFREPLRTSVIEQLGYRDGKKHGSHVKFQAGKKIYECTFKNGLKHGREMRFSDTGEMIRSCDYELGHGTETILRKGSREEIQYSIRDGLEVAEFKQFRTHPPRGHFADKEYLFEQGTKIEGNLVGRYQNFWVDGSLKKNTFYEYDPIRKKSHETGLCEEFYPNGVLKTKTHLRQGGNNILAKRHGLHEEYSEDGVLLIRSHYQRFKLCGLQETFSPTGTLGSRVHYKDNELHGSYELFHENGVKKTSAVYFKSEKNGLCIEYFETGIVCSKSTFKDNKKTGLAEEYFDSGNLKARGSYLEDYKHGQWEYFQDVTEKHDPRIETHNSEDEKRNALASHRRLSSATTSEDIAEAMGGVGMMSDGEKDVFG